MNYSSCLIYNVFDSPNPSKVPILQNPKTLHFHQISTFSSLPEVRSFMVLVSLYQDFIRTTTQVLIKFSSVSKYFYLLCSIQLTYQSPVLPYSKLTNCHQAWSRRIPYLSEFPKTNHSNIHVTIQNPSSLTLFILLDIVPLLFPFLNFPCIYTRNMIHNVRRPFQRRTWVHPSSYDTRSFFFVLIPVSLT